MRVIIFLILMINNVYAIFDIALPPLKLEPSYQNKSCKKNLHIVDKKESVMIKKNDTIFSFSKKQEYLENEFITVDKYQIDCYTKDILKISYILESEMGQYFQDNLFYDFKRKKEYAMMALKILDLPSKYKNDYIIGYSVVTILDGSSGNLKVLNLKSKKQTAWYGDVAYYSNNKKIKTKFGLKKDSKFRWRPLWDGEKGAENIYFKDDILTFPIRETHKWLPDKRITIDLKTVCQEPSKLVTSRIRCYDIK